MNWNAFLQYRSRWGDYCLIEGLFWDVISRRLSGNLDFWFCVISEINSELPILNLYDRMHIATWIFMRMPEGTKCVEHERECTRPCAPPESGMHVYARTPAHK